MSIMIVNGGPFVVGRKHGNNWQIWDEGFATYKEAEAFIGGDQTMAVLDLRTLIPTAVSTTPTTKQ